MENPTFFKIAVFICVLFIQSKIIQAQNNATPIDSALIACYPFSGNAIDATGNGNNGTVNNAVLVNDRNNVPNSAYSFNGANQNIVIPGFSTKMTSNEFSISFWATSTLQATRSAFILTPDDPSNRFNIHIYYVNQTYFDFGSIFSNGRLYMPTSPLPPLNTWDHWVFVQSTSNNFMKCYKNGVLILNKVGASSFSNASLKNLLIGGGLGVNEAYLWFNGKLDDIKIYNRVLIQNDVTTLYTTPFSCSGCQSPPAPINNSPISNQFLCAGASASLSVISTGTVQWFSPSSTVSVGSGLTFTTQPLPAGTHTFIARNTSTCTESIQTAIVVTINPIPILTVTGNNTLCAGESATLNCSGATNYFWSTGGTTATEILSPLVSTQYTVVGTNNDGCTSSTLVNIFVNPLPTVSVAGNNTICSGASATLTASGGVNYAWSNGVVGPVNTFSAPANTQLVIICTGGNGCKANYTVSVYVNPLPSLTVTTEREVICRNNPNYLTVSGALTYSWSQGDTTSTVLVSPNVPTVYTVTGTDQNGCMSSVTYKQQVSACSGIDDQKKLTSVFCYPNPVSDVLVIELPSKMSKANLEVYDLVGKLVLRETLNQVSNEIDLRALKSGVYLISIVKSDQIIYHQKMIKE